MVGVATCTFQGAGLMVGMVTTVHIRGVGLIVGVATTRGAGLMVGVATILLHFFPQMMIPE